MIDEVFFIEYIFSCCIHLYISNPMVALATILVMSGVLPRGSINNFRLHTHDDATWKIIG
jgi:hypothetical protein